MFQEFDPLEVKITFNYLNLIQKLEKIDKKWDLSLD